MNFNRLIIALLISYLMFTAFSTAARAAEDFEEITIHIMDVNEDTDDFINHIEIPTPAPQARAAAQAGKRNEASEKLHPEATEQRDDEVRGNRGGTHQDGLEAAETAHQPVEKIDEDARAATHEDVEHPRGEDR